MRSRVNRQTSSLKRNILAILLLIFFVFLFFLFFQVDTSKYTQEKDETPSKLQTPILLPINIRNENECDPVIHAISWKPRIFLYKNFLSEDETNFLVNKGKDRLSRSMVAGADNDVVSDHRTSSGVFIDTEGDPKIIDIEKRIAEWTTIPPIHYESFYLLKYEEGEEYKAHYDFFDSSLTSHLGKGGQRMATVILCLSPAEEGGTTSFPKVGITIEMERGDALLFYDRLPNGKTDDLTLHSGDPVIKGTKWIATKWIRERPYENNWYSREKNKPIPNPNAVNPFTGLPESIHH